MLRIEEVIAFGVLTFWGSVRHFKGTMGFLGLVGLFELVEGVIILVRLPVFRFLIMDNLVEELKEFCGLCWSKMFPIGCGCCC